jgi:16S rRNA (guanine527-N7)-methyltransferase
MTSSQIAALLGPYIVGLTLPLGIYDQLAAYLDLLLRWNAKTNLTAIRKPEEIVTRHFGESLFAAKVLVQDCGIAPAATLADLGSGAGFPGMPIKLALPDLHVTLIESQNKKATFLKEVIRQLGLTGIDVFNDRAERWGRQADVVTMRAVEKFEAALPGARQLLVPGGKLCLLISGTQGQAVQQIADLKGLVEQNVPRTNDSVIWVGVAT